MIKFILFIKKIHFVLLFIVLESLAIRYYANSTSYTKAKLVTASNFVVGGIYSQLSGLNSYFHLRSENEALTEELSVLRNRMDGLLSYVEARDSSAMIVPDSSVLGSDTALFFTDGTRRYEYFSARVLNNSIVRQENYITLNKGELDGLTPDMALISESGIVGYILGCSDNFSVCMSVLNRNFKTSGKIKNENYFGSVFWDGRSYEHVTLSEIPKYAAIEIGDTIVTTDYSSIFPPDVMIGTVEAFELKNATYYEVKVKLHSNMARLRNVLVVKYLDGGERKALEESVVTPEVY